MNQTVSLSLTPKQIQDLKHQYAQKLAKSANAYVDGMIQIDGCTITIYTSGKVVMQGPEAQSIASAYLPKLFAQAGSDEVGTGDYFGPVVVCAAYVDDKIMEKLKDLPITDSKVLTDPVILDIAPKIMKAVPYSALIVENTKYNEIQATHNLNAIKALLHNQAYIHLKKKLRDLPPLTVVDQFTPEGLYYRYIKDEPMIIRGLHFETKAESKYPAVAIASIIARYKFLKVWEKMESDFDFTFPKGASDLVDEAGRRFLDRFGEEKLHQVAKVHFKTTQKIKSTE